MVALSRPIDVQRIRTLLAGNHVHFDDWENNQLVVPTPNAIYLWDATYPNVLIMRGIWRGIARNDAQFYALECEIEACNSMRTAPKAYLAPLEDQTSFGLHTECAILTSAGLTDQQLSTFYETSMAMTMSFFHDLETTLPEFITWEREEKAQ